MKLPVEGREEEEDLEYYGPIDGVLPQDYPAAYSRLMTMYCVIKSIVRVYTCDKLRICTNCYDETQDDEKEYYEEGGWHSMCLYTTTLVASTCFKCNVQLATVKPASRCQECIEEYLELGQEGWSHLNRGGCLDVITRW